MFIVCVCVHESHCGFVARNEYVQWAYMNERGWNFIYCTGIRHVAIQLHSFTTDSMCVNAQSAHYTYRIFWKWAKREKKKKVKSIPSMWSLRIKIYSFTQSNVCIFTKGIEQNHWLKMHRFFFKTAFAVVDRHSTKWILATTFFMSIYNARSKCKHKFFFFAFYIRTTPHIFFPVYVCVCVCVGIGVVPFCRQVAALFNAFSATLINL